MKPKRAHSEPISAYHPEPPKKSARAIKMDRYHEAFAEAAYSFSPHTEYQPWFGKVKAILREKGMVIDGSTIDELHTQIRQWLADNPP